MYKSMIFNIQQSQIILPNPFEWCDLLTATV